MKIESHDKFLQEQIEYYRARANEYDEWFFRQGRYDRGPELNQRWFSEIELLRQALDKFKPAGTFWNWPAAREYGRNIYCGLKVK